MAVPQGYILVPPAFNTLMKDIFLFAESLTLTRLGFLRVIFPGGGRSICSSLSFIYQKELVISI